MLQEKESWDMNTEEKITVAGKKKEEGNIWFRAGKYQRASKRYEKVCHDMLFGMNSDPFWSKNNLTKFC